MGSRIDSVEKWCAWALRRCLRNEDVVFLTTGYEGSGKSTLGLWLWEQKIRVVAAKLRITIPEFTVEDNLAFNGRQYIRKTNRLPPLSYAQWDETKEGGTKSEGMTKENRGVAGWFEVNRERNLIQNVIKPNRFSVHPYIHNHRALWWFFIRGDRVVEASEGQRNKNSPHVFWRTRFTFDFDRPSSDLESSYLTAKREYTHKYARDQDRIEKSETLVEELERVKRAIAWLPGALQNFRGERSGGRISKKEAALERMVLESLRGTNLDPSTRQGA